MPPVDASFRFLSATSEISCNAPVAAYLVDDNSNRSKPVFL